MYIQNKQTICAAAIPTERPLVQCFHVELESVSVGFCGGRKTGDLERNPRSKARTNSPNRHKVQFRARTTLVGGERPRHCAIPVPLKIK